MSDRIPVTLLTGFLGAGKSTLLSAVLRDPRFSDTAIVVNEFGEVGLDGALIAHAPEQIVETTTGCLCCTIRGDIREALVRLHARMMAGEVAGFSRLVIETTGLADPAPPIQTLIADPRLARRFALAGVVTAVDAVNGDATLDRHEEAVRQVAVADRIVLTKTDLARDPASRRDLDALAARLQALAPGAVILDRNAPEFDLRRLFDMTAFDPGAKSMDVRGWLNAESLEADGHSHHEHGHGHDHHHDVSRHGPDIRAFCVTLDEPVPTMGFTTALEILIANQGPALLRVKGVVCLAEKPERPIVIHGAQHVFHDPVILDAWPDADRRTRLVFITQGVGQAPVDAFLRASCAAGVAPAAPT
ncbi:CobW family GTP-binding protein [Rubrimonas sp.]|uniref:CobW family GTP-binding protein n=1 Tax=Rubrimonas sp. TaxID=2036015 RepID=UPI002FDC9815